MWDTSPESLMEDDRSTLRKMAEAASKTASSRSAFLLKSVTQKWIRSDVARLRPSDRTEERLAAKADRRGTERETGEKVTKRGTRASKASVAHTAVGRTLAVDTRMVCPKGVIICCSLTLGG